MDMSGANFSHRYSVDTRRRWSEEEKQAIIAEALQPGVNVSAVARRHGIKPSLLFRWRKLAKRREAGARAGIPADLFDGVSEEPRHDLRSHHQ